MVVDVSGAWTSLTCYYTLHDKIVALQAENERLLEAGDAMHAYLARVDGTTNGQLDVRTNWDNARVKRNK